MPTHQKQLESINWMHKQGRDPVARSLKSREFHQRVVPLEKQYRRSKFKKFHVEFE